MIVIIHPLNDSRVSKVDLGEGGFKDLQNPNSKHESYGDLTPTPHLQF